MSKGTDNSNTLDSIYDCHRVTRAFRYESASAGSPDSVEGKNEEESRHLNKSVKSAIVYSQQKTDIAHIEDPYGELRLIQT